MAITARCTLIDHNKLYQSLLTSGELRMGLWVLGIWVRRWATAALTTFDHTFLAAPPQPPVTARTPTAAQGWLVALEAASRGWNSWHS
ncbi:hypothetical protein [Thiothrix fructosivorans]|uniref:Uncharacterized protein n=1 Tax=Thiothrix fructosivorans TaxID=111770 RepID=A0A8B0SQV3_9GAMM|nr:hypothetical protein [Thiothrix fructosivorans]MBO0613281.1 hypothetical protein [Thiothrix fructosivorans]QTX11282.1 hypothetical protein J1836_002685 [Thiothrix fructosivorans]